MAPVISGIVVSAPLGRYLEHAIGGLDTDHCTEAYPTCPAA
jgi:hypothetical protein